VFDCCCKPHSCCPHGFISRECRRRDVDLFETDIFLRPDNEVNQAVVTRQLEIFDFTADIAENGRLAFERWQTGGYDCC